MQINDIVIPHNVRGITVDLWETLFYDSHYSMFLNNIREKIIDEVLVSKKISLNVPTKDIFIAERQRFQNYEKMGEFLPLSERLGFITEYKLSPNEIGLIAKKIS